MITRKIFKIIWLSEQNNKGFTLILPIIILVSVFTVFVISLNLTSSFLISANGFLLNSKKALGVADACAESALWHIKNNSSYTGTLSLTLGSASCSATTIDSASNKQISITASSQNVYKKISILAQFNGSRVMVSNWTEVQNF